MLRQHPQSHPHANVKVLEFQSFCIFSCILILFIILKSPLQQKFTAVAHPAAVAPLVSSRPVELIFFSNNFKISIFLAHLSRRLKWAIVIGHRLSSVCPSSSVRKLSHFQLLLWNCWTEFNETWQDARSQRPLPSLCFSGRSEKQDSRPSLWLAETFSNSSLKPMNRIQRNLTGSKISMSSTKFVFCGPIGKPDWLRHFRLLLWNHWTEFNETWQEARS